MTKKNRNSSKKKVNKLAKLIKKVKNMKLGGRKKKSKSFGNLSARARGNRVMNTSGFGLLNPNTKSPLVSRYITAVVDPFDDRAKGSSVLVNNSGPSYKVNSTIRFPVTVGANGTAQIVFAPSACNDVVQVVYSSNAATYVSSTLSTTYGGGAPTPGLSTQIMAQLPFTSAQINTDKTVSSRVISAGIRITYTGDPLYRRGTFYSFVSPNRELVAGSSDSAGIKFGQQPAASMESLSDIMGHSFTDVQFGLDNDELNYSMGVNGSVVIYPYCGRKSYTAGTDIPATAGLWITGANAGQTVICEYIVHVEYTGRFAAPFYSPTESAVDLQNQIVTKAGELAMKVASNPRIPRGLTFKKMWGMVPKSVRTAAAIYGRKASRYAVDSMFPGFGTLIDRVPLNF